MPKRATVELTDDLIKNSVLKPGPSARRKIRDALCIDDIGLLFRHRRATHARAGTGATEYREFHAVAPDGTTSILGTATGMTVDQARARVVQLNQNLRLGRGDTSRPPPAIGTTIGPIIQQYRHKRMQDAEDRIKRREKNRPPVEKLMQTDPELKLLPWNDKSVANIDCHLEPFMRRYGNHRTENFHFSTLLAYVEKNYRHVPPSAVAFVKMFGAAFNLCTQDNFAIYDKPSDKRSPYVKLPSGVTNPASGMVAKVEWMRTHEKGTWKVGIGATKMAEILYLFQFAEGARERLVAAAYQERLKRGQPTLATHPFVAMAMQLVLLSGTRPAEVMSMRLSDLHDEVLFDSEGQRHLVIVGTRDSKTTDAYGKRRFLRWGSIGRAVLERAAKRREQEGYGADCEFVFPSRLSASGHIETVAEFCSFLGPRLVELGVPNFTPYNLRSAGLNVVFDMAAGAQVASAFGGHSETTFKRYYQTMSDDTLNAATLDLDLTMRKHLTRIEARGAPKEFRWGRQASRAERYSPSANVRDDDDDRDAAD